MIVLVGAVNHCRRFRPKAPFVCVSWMNMSSLRPVWRCQARHPSSPLMTISIWIWPIFHPRLLVSLRRRAIAHDDTAVLLATNNTILSVLNVLVLILGDRSVQCPRSVMTLFIDLLLDWFNLMKMVSLRVSILIMNSTVRVLWIGVCMMVTTSVAVDFGLSRWTSIRHRDVVWAWTSVPQWTVFRRILWTSISIRRTARTSRIITWEVICRLVSSSSIALRMNIVICINSLLLVINRLLASFLYSPL